MDGSAALLNDTAKTVFTYAAQLPYFKIAYDDLRLELQDNNIPISSKRSTVLKLIAGAHIISYATIPALPVDFVEIIAVWAKNTGTDGFHFLERKSYLAPVSDVQTQIYEYSYREQTITIPNTNQAMDIQLDYIGDPFGADSPEQTTNSVTEISIGRVFNALNFLKYRNAALCSEFIGENKERADSLNMNALRTLEILLNISIKGSQNISTRRKKFRGSI